MAVHSRARMLQQTPFSKTKWREKENESVRKSRKENQRGSSRVGEMFSGPVSGEDE